MEYIFGYYDNGTETVKTKDTVHSDLKGFQIVSRDYEDCTIVDSFYVIKKTASNEDVEGMCYDWYLIDKHSRYVDKTKCIKPELETKADLVDGKVPESQLPEMNVDAYSKNETLSEETKTTFGLDVDAVPDDALSAIKTLIDGANANANAKAKIATGSYRGTSNYGSSNKNTLSFDFVPKVVVVVANGAPGVASGSVFVKGQTNSNYIGYTNNTAVGIDLQWSGNGVSWYSDTAERQLNRSGYTYYYTAIG